MVIDGLLIRRSPGLSPAGGTDIQRVSQVRRPGLGDILAGFEPSSSKWQAGSLEAVAQDRRRLSELAGPLCLELELDKSLDQGLGEYADLRWLVATALVREVDRQPW
jgi:hypothetical protein